MNDIIFGRRIISEALKTGKQIDKLLIKKGKQEGSIIPIIKQARDKGIVIQEVEHAKLDALCENENHQGIVAYCSNFEYSSIDDILNLANTRSEAPFILICDRITDPHNLGAIIRSAACVGVHGVIIPKRNSALVNSVVQKTSAGACEHIKIAKVTNLASTIDLLKQRGLWVAGADMGGQSMYDIDLKGPLAIVIGNEGEGISRLIHDKCDFIASIPMTGVIDSLNASVACGVLLYEAHRQRS